VKRRTLIISCEHGGRVVPAAYAALFDGHGALLDSHRGWDPGALMFARQMAKAFDAKLVASRTTRLLVDLNRSIGHRSLFSELSSGLTRSARREVVDRFYRPHRDAIEGEIARRIAAGRPVLHIASHSFTPVLGGVVRQADVGFLYDPRRASEAGLAQRWLVELARRAPALRLRRNYPYRGRGDGLATALRRRFPDTAYTGIELELNQRFAAQGGAAWGRLRADLIAALTAVL